MSFDTSLFFPNYLTKLLDPIIRRFRADYTPISGGLRADYARITRGLHADFARILRGFCVDFAPIIPRFRALMFSSRNFYDIITR